ncbi:MAG: twin-arginine translocase TatA/TatE family subunit, partial [Thermoanaerobaculia bacterium]
MGSVGFPELLVILVVAALVFGPRRLPEIGRSIGGALSAFKEGLNDPQKQHDSRRGSEASPSHGKASPEQLQPDQARAAARSLRDRNCPTAKA